MLEMLPVHCFARVERVLQHFTFNQDLLLLHLSVQLLLVHGRVEGPVVVGLDVFSGLHALVLFSLKDFLVVLDHCAPFVQIAVFGDRVVALALRVQTHDRFVLLV